MWWPASIEALSRFNLWVMGLTALCGFIAFLLEALPTGRLSWLRAPIRDRGKLWMTGLTAVFGVVAFVGSVKLSNLEAAAAAPRAITEESRNEFLEAVGPNRKGKIHVGIKAQDQEAALFGEQMVQLLESGGWQVTAAYVMTTGPMEPGVVVTVRTNTPPPPEAVLLMNGLKVAGIDATGRVLPDLPADESLRMTIAQKQ